MLRPQTPVCDTFELHYSFLNSFPKLDICTFQLLVWALSLCKILVTCQQATILDLPSYDILSHKNFLFGKTLMTWLHVVCGLGLSHWKIRVRQWIGDRLKNFFENFFLRTLTAASLVLGLEHSCPWPREGRSSERLSLTLASAFFVSLASRGSVLGKALLHLGLGFFLCPWP